MGQENEEKAELLATIQHEHVKMKAWYNSAPEAKSALHAKYGSSYPSFWRDVVTWDGWKSSRKLFLKSMELKEKKLQRNEANNITSSSGTTSHDVSNESSSAGGNSKRKRKSRWGVSNESTATTTANKSSPPKRKSRWGDRGRDNTSKPLSTNASTTSNGTAAGSSVLDILPGLPTNLNAEQSAKLKELQGLLKEANKKLENLEVEAKRVDALPVGHPDRSPSPPPVYGVDGKRKNTRAVRWRERYTTQRQDTLEQILSLTTSNPTATSSIAPSLFKRKRTRKIHIPVEQHPTYNFIGLIIGPRGKTQKDMESKTNCKIAIRGKGSVKEGARGRRDGKMMEGDDEPLHVVITGDNQANVDAAAEMITNMLVVIDDDKNVHKQQQLRELALLNGTLKEDEYCPICGEKGHRAYECPKRFLMDSKKGPKLGVKCEICGSTSHVTSDCPMKNLKNPQVDKELDSDYMAFMNELDGKAPGDTEEQKASAAAAEAAAAERKQQLESLVTTIEKTAGGVTTKFAPVVPTKQSPVRNNGIDITDVPAPTTSTAPPAPAVPPPTGGSLITTISSRIVKSSATGEKSQSTGGGVAPSGTAIDPTAAGKAPAPPASFATTTALPPPPSSSVPPSQPHYYGHQQQPPPPPPQPGQQRQVHQGSYYGNQSSYGYQQQKTQYQNSYNAGGYQKGNTANQGYYGQQSYQNGGAGWDYTNYYGTGNTGGDADGAGGFNWWESS